MSLPSESRSVAIELHRAEATVCAAEAAIALADSQIGLLSARMATVRALAAGLGIKTTQPPAATGLAWPAHSTGSNLSENEFAELMGVSQRTIANDRAEMTEGVHYHCHGRRVLYHVPEAADFIRQRKPLKARGTDATRLAVDEVTQRRARVALRKSRLCR